MRVVDIPSTCGPGHLKANAGRGSAAHQELLSEQVGQLNDILTSLLERLDPDAHMMP
jgi:hypothetical protein